MLRGLALISLGAALLFFCVRDGLIEQRIPFYGKYRSRSDTPRYIAEGGEALVYGALGCFIGLTCAGIGVYLIRGGNVPWRKGIGWPSE